MCIGLGMGATVIWENPHHTNYSGTAVNPASQDATTATDTEGAAA